MLEVCDDCTTRYSVDAPKCPQCGSTKSHPAYEVDDAAAAPKKKAAAKS